MTAAHAPSNRGFTLVELIVASSAMSVALLGVYAVLRQAAEVERRVSQRWEQQAAAESVVDLITGSIERCINLRGLTALSAAPGAGGDVYTLTCTTMTPGHGYGDPRPCVERRRFHWKARPAEGEDIRVHMQVMPYAGSTNISPARRSEGDAESDIWPDVQRVLVARDLKQLTVRFRPAAGDEIQWKASYRGTGEQTLVRVQARSGDVLVERYATIKASARLEGGS